LAKFTDGDKFDAAVDEVKRVLLRDIITMTSDEFVTDDDIKATLPEILLRVTLFEGVLAILDSYQEKVVAGVLIASRVIHWNKEKTPKRLPFEVPRCVMDDELIEQAQACLNLMIGETNKEN